jgi:hypothetical protein
MSKTTMNRFLSVLLCAAVGGLATAELSGCGGDEPGAKKPEKRAGGKRKGKRAGAGGGGGGKAGKAGRLLTAAKVPDEYRIKFTDEQFVPDITGDVNRDPFRSYVVNTGKSSGDAETQNPNELCTKENSVAPNYSLRSLRLIGIVLRGTRSYALFRDTGAFGHIVRRGDCLGKEQARVEIIGTGFVRMSVIPEAPPGAPAPAPQTRDIQLYPAEMDIENVVEGSEAPGGE